MQLDRAWDVVMVAEALVRAYQLLDGAPVLSRDGWLSVNGERLGPRPYAVWIGVRRYVPDPWDLRILRTWASCVAGRESVNARYKGHGWHPKTADRRRRAALKAIAAGLNAEREMVALAEA